MKKPLIVYTTRTGHTRELAAMLAGRFGTSSHEVVDKVNRKGAVRFVFSGFQATTKKATPIEEAPVDIADHDGIILVVPIWASNLVPPMRTWLQKHAKEIIGKPVAVLASNKGSDIPPYEQNVKAEFPFIRFCEGCVETVADKTSLVERFAKRAEAL